MRVSNIQRVGLAAAVAVMSQLFAPAIGADPGES